MKATQKRELQSFRRVEAWLVAHPELLPSTTTVGAGATSASTPGSAVPAASAALATQLESLRGVVSRVTTYAAEQDAQQKLSTRDGTNALQLRDELRQHHMRPITQAAQALRKTVPGIGGALRMPKSHADSEALVSAANAMAQNAAIYQDVLIEHGMPADFIDQLNAAAAAVKQGVDQRGAARARRVGATKGVRTELQLGHSTVGLIGAALSRLLRGQPALLAEWENAKRVTIKGAAGTGTLDSGAGGSSSPPAPAGAQDVKAA